MTTVVGISKNGASCPAVGQGWHVTSSFQETPLRGIRKTSKNFRPLTTIGLTFNASFRKAAGFFYTFFGFLTYDFFKWCFVFLLF